MHFVDEELDHGAIIVQKAMPVLDDDDNTLALRILEQEHVAYTEAIKLCLVGSSRSGRRRLKTNIGVSARSRCNPKLRLLLTSLPFSRWAKFRHC